MAAPKPKKNITIFFSVSAEEMTALQALRNSISERADWRFMFFMGVVSSHVSMHLKLEDEAHCPFGDACGQTMANFLQAAVENLGLTLGGIMKEGD